MCEPLVEEDWFIGTEQVLRAVPCNEGEMMVVSHVCHKARKLGGILVSQLVIPLEHLGRTEVL